MSAISAAACYLALRKCKKSQECHYNKYISSRLIAKAAITKTAV
jgi:hypothetical protein